MARKVIQICESSVSVNYDDKWDLTALCDDGTMWFLDSMYGKWKRLPDVSNDNDENCKEGENV